MRKRERDRLVKKLRAIHDKFVQFATDQLDGSIWYFENNAEGKGYSFGYSAAQNATALGKELDKFITEEANKSGFRRGK